MDFIRFQQCVGILKQFTIAQLQANRQSLSAQRSTLLAEQEKLSRDVKQAAAAGARVNDNLTQRSLQLQNGDLATYKANLQLQQQQGLDSRTTLLTIARLVETQKSMDRLAKSIQNNNLLVTQKAKVLAKVMQDIDQMTNEIALMDDCQSISDFLTAEKLTPDLVSDYELERLYRLYGLGV